MKKILSVLMATLMFLTLLMPLSVFAENGPYPMDWWENTDEEDIGDITNIAAIGVIDYDTFDMGYVYPAFMAEFMPVQEEGSITYDEKTNTLNLKNFKTTKILTITSMGDDFKINVSGYNEIGSIISSAMSWGCSITVTGNGSLVVNPNKTYPSAVTLDVSGTGYGFFKTEKTVATKFFGNIDTELGEAEPTIYVSGSKESDPSKVIILEGDVKSDKELKAEPFEVVVYEQIKACIVDKYWGTDEYFVSDKEEFKGRLFVGETYDDVLYDLYEVVYDEELKNYIIVYDEEFCEIKLDDYGFKTATGETSVPAVILDIWPEPVDMDTCIDENDKLCAFSEYYDENDKPYYEVYEIVEHTKYGNLALIYNPKDTYKKLNVKGTETYYDCINESQVITTNTIVKSVPAKVTLKKAANAYGGVKVTWNTVEGASKYKVYRSQYDTKTKKWSKWSGVGYSQTDSYLDKTAKNGVKYKYTVRAENALGLGAYDKTGVSTTYIAAPTVKIANTASGIKVSWSKVSGATGYTVYRSQYSGGKWSGWKNMGTAKSDKSSWTDKNVKSGVQYKYTVRTVKNKLMSSYKGTAGLVFLSQPTVKIANASTGVKVSWSKVGGATGYTVYRSELSNGKWTKWKNMGTAKSDKSAWTDKSAKSGTQYKYTVRAVNGASKSTYKATAGLLYLAQPTVEIANATKGVKVSWSKVSGATGYTVYRSELSNGKWSGWKNMGTAKSDKSAWTDKSVKSGTQYKYTVRAVNGKVKSSYKATSGLVFISAPTLKATNASYSVKVSWSKVTGATQYKLYRSELKDGKWSSWSTLTTLEANTTSFVDKTVAVGSVYKYTLKAINGSSLSVAASADEIWYSYAPTISIVNGETGMVVNWEHINGADKYVFYRSEEKNGKWTEWKTIKTVNATTEYWVDETVVSDVKYKYAIKAQKGDDKTVSKVSNELVYIKTRYGS